MRGEIAGVSGRDPMRMRANWKVKGKNEVKREMTVGSERQCELLPLSM